MYFDPEFLDLVCCCANFNEQIFFILFQFLLPSIVSPCFVLIATKNTNIRRLSPETLIICAIRTPNYKTVALLLKYYDCCA